MPAETENLIKFKLDMWILPEDLRALIAAIDNAQMSGRESLKRIFQGELEKWEREHA